MKKTIPRLSILIATYNAAETLKRCLDSIVRQKYANWELIVIDGGSSDGTVEILSMYSKHLSYWHSKKDSGIYDAWNQAILQATGEYVCFIGADDYFIDERSLENVFAPVGTSEYDLISSKGIFIKSGSAKKYVIGKPWSFKRLERRITVCHPGLLHNRKLFQKYGLFDTEYRIVGDYEFLLRLPSSTITMHVDSPLVYIDDGGISRSRFMDMLVEKRKAQALCPRIREFKAGFNYYDKLWRVPIAKILNIPY